MQFLLISLALAAPIADPSIGRTLVHSTVAGAAGGASSAATFALVNSFLNRPKNQQPQQQQPQQQPQQQSKDAKDGHQVSVSVNEFMKLTKAAECSKDQIQDVETTATISIPLEEYKDLIKKAAECPK